MQRRKCSNLPKDIIEEILLRLPVKSLVRFKCVCKIWKACFRNPTFIEAHHRSQRAIDNAEFMPSKFLVKRTTIDATKIIDKVFFTFLELTIDGKKNVTLKDKENIFFPFLEKDNGPYLHRYSDHGQVRVFGSCNGILCLARDEDTVLWNPATREVKFLQPSTLIPAVGSYCRSSSIMAFGYDPKNDDYKVLRRVFDILSDHDNDDLMDDSVYRLELYSFKKNEWRLLPDAYACYLEPSEFNMCINGVYHMHYDYMQLLSFDLVDENFTFTECPTSVPACTGNIRKITPVDNRLGIVTYTAEDGFFKIWVLQEIGVKDSWTKHMTVGPVDGVTRFLGFWKKMMFVEINREQIAVYNPENIRLQALRFTPIDEHEMEFNNYVSMSEECWDEDGRPIIFKYDPHYDIQFIYYVESLVPINGRHEHEEGVVHSLF